MVAENQMRQPIISAAGRQRLANRQLLARQDRHTIRIVSVYLLIVGSIFSGRVRFFLSQVSLDIAVLCLSIRFIRDDVEYA